MKKIVLVCAQGMSTGMLMNKMRAAAEKQGYECSIEAYAVSAARTKAADADVILVGPQVRYELDNVKNMFPDKPVAVINMVDYGRLNGEGVLNNAKKLMND
ncbi:MAG: PTS sugar transporter subunit IIB [Erysipelotrichaceae bacterium]|jgi:PTS system cellobiose-specific IIB component|nr:PTS sugar transporter subunit IIB [Erysipelotrichaceae bacterium]